MAKQLEGVEAEYLFFAAYLQKDTEQENWDVNGGLVMSTRNLYRPRWADLSARRRCNAEELP